ncbi:glycosyltransferase [Leptothoe sp. ISB3NOV94-8A]|uniref:Glycosyltransferase family 1 protein n=1 Tax=Adonisia turfae CCMR0081 TaxID=2292702 RepID=A0A6M0RMP5_9CYAN|nr:glycosyltransferase [Adonisia turfae]NEZ57052.1 glycosyltransferase family 1 protein [Adonisia turfae CCMR0081]
MAKKRLKVLLIIEQCNPAWNSVPLEGYRLYAGISRFVDTTLVTHARNREELERIHPDADITYIEDSKLIENLELLGDRLSLYKGQIIWPLRNAFTYPVYWGFNRAVYSRFKEAIVRGDYDLVHTITPMMPRYPVKAIKACKKTPFILGPVNGGVPFPDGFKELGRREYSYFNFLRWIGRSIIPGYRETYKKAHYILAGSSYTLSLIKELFPKTRDNQIELFYENGITSSFVRSEEEVAQAKIPTEASVDNKVKLLYVGRLVPYKGADMILDAISKLDESIKLKIHLTIVGNGSEQESLEHQVKQLKLNDHVHFTGYVEQYQTLEYYRQSDIFCFPSVREFGGAVVLEAMANALPCIVVDNGGIGEYVTEKTGFKIDPLSREFVVNKLAIYIAQLVEDHIMRHDMSYEALQRAKEFTWDTKTRKIVDIYSEVVEREATTV